MDLGQARTYRGHRCRISQPYKCINLRWKSDSPGGTLLIRRRQLYRTCSICGLVRPCSDHSPHRSHFVICNEIYETVSGRRLLLIMGPVYWNKYLFCTFQFRGRSNEQNQASYQCRLHSHIDRKRIQNENGLAYSEDSSRRSKPPTEIDSESDS